MNLAAWGLLLAAILPPAKLPFTIDASQDASADFPGAPRLQAFSFAQWKGKWVFIGGRTAGYHSMGGGTADFLRADANQEVWVVDTAVKPARTYHAPVEQLPARLAPVKDQWTSSAQLYFQDGSKLYIAGGYGEDHTGKWVTFPVISEVDLPSLIDGVMKGRLATAEIAFAHSPLVQSAGGQLIRLADGYFYVVMGHVFTGSYTAFEGQGEHNAEGVSQTYLNEIRKLRIEVTPQGLAVTLVRKYRDETAFHRRDLNVTPILTPQGLGLAAYGGVFTPETQVSYSNPVYLLGGSQPRLDTDFEQKMNAYSCAHLLLYDPPSQTMFTTFFGGIGRFSWDPEARVFVENPKVGSKTESTYFDGMQWSDQVSTIRKVMAAGREQTTEFVQPGFLPGFVGTDAVFIPVSEMARVSGTEILDFEAMPRTKTLVGYIYGGIRASPYRFPYSKTSTPYNGGTVPTKASELVLKVYLQPARQ